MEPWIKDYQEAFRAANPGAPVPQISSRGGGWWSLRSFHATDKKRKSDIVAMTGRLRLIRPACSPPEPRKD
jgi:hypothetical protein